MNYEEIICDANNLYRAYKVSVKTSKWKETTQKFMMNFLRYIFYEKMGGNGSAQKIMLEVNKLPIHKSTYVEEN